MEANIMKTISYKEKRLLVSELCLMYKRLTKTSDMIKLKANSRKDMDENILNDNAYKSILQNEKIVSIFETIMTLMPTSQRIILEKDFIKEDTQEWYLQFWSKSTYYKLKHETMDTFLTLMYA